MKTKYKKKAVEDLKYLDARSFEVSMEISDDLYTYYAELKRVMTSLGVDVKGPAESQGKIERRYNRMGRKLLKSYDMMTSCLIESGKISRALASRVKRGEIKMAPDDKYISLSSMRDYARDLDAYPEDSQEELLGEAIRYRDGEDVKPCEKIMEDFVKRSEEDE